ncbi:MAG: hypothetical protein HY956_03470 [Deltaproteobacteria bacterium]|nr:hypothetical protein [Deltaproteobacteria bacterium]
MANRIRFREFTGFEDTGVKEEAVDFMEVKARGRNASGQAAEGVFFLLNDTCVMLISGKKLMPQ